VADGARAARIYVYCQSGYHMTAHDIGCVLKKAYSDIMNNHTTAMAAGLAYYFVMSLFPLLILVAAIVSFFPRADLFNRLIAAMATVVPPDSMGIVRGVVHDVVNTNHGGFLTFGILGTLWAASGGFAGLIEALNVAYDVPETRPIWKTRLLALQLMVVISTVLLLGVLLMFVGPQFGGWLAGKVGLSEQFADAWPTLRWIASVGLIVLGIELIFFWAPNVRQRFRATLPGAIIATGFWIGTSFALGLYFRSFAHYNKTYGTLASAVALMAWLYYSWFVILIGAEINAELLKAGDRGRLPLKQQPPRAIRSRPPWEADTRTDAEKARQTGAARDVRDTAA
jgi:membrane protein